MENTQLPNESQPLLSTHKGFTDKIVTTSKNKTVISVRDGYQEYLGSELGIEDASTDIKVYRSADTIRDITKDTVGIPVTIGHVPLTDEIPEDKIVGYVDSANIVNYDNRNLHSTIAIKNKINMNEDKLAVLDKANQLSLGYFADIREHDIYDYEQVNIEPHHLAIVPRGRCGDVCKFKDGQDKPNSEVTISRVDAILEQLPEAFKNMPTTKLEALVPILEQSILESREKSVMGVKIKQEENNMAEKKPNETDEDVLNEEGTEKDEGVKTETEPVEDEEVKLDADGDFDGDEEGTEGSMEEGEEEDDDKKVKSDFKDSIEFKDAVKAEAAMRVEVIEKAKTFLDATYDYSKDTVEIMRDALATQTSDSFKDNEVPVAFKVLKKTADYSSFGDEAVSEWDTVAKKEI